MVLLTRHHMVDSQRLFEGKIISLRVDKLKLPDGRLLSREIVEHGGGVVIACQPSPDQVMLIKQYRYPVDEELIELPAGRVEPGEDPLVCAKRELIEETGWQATDWEELPAMYSAPGFCSELLHVYRASKLSFVGIAPDEDEEIEVLTVTLEKAWQLVKDGKVRDAKTIAGLGLLINK